MDRARIRRLLWAYEHVLLRTVFFVAFVGSLFFVGISIEGLRMNDVFRVTVPRLNIREEPRLNAQALHYLERGAHVSCRGEQVDNDGYPWIRIAYLRNPSPGVLQDWHEGWVAGRGQEGDPFIEKETRVLRKPFVAGHWLKWKAVHRVDAVVQGAPVPSALKRVVHAHPDKALHVVMMGLLGCGTFLFLLFDDRITSLQALVASLVVTNGLGMINEGLDLVRESGSFELRDLAANALGSAAVLPAFLLWVALRRMWAERGGREAASDLSRQDPADS